jgi:hypothetical protein
MATQIVLPLIGFRVEVSTALAFVFSDTLIYADTDTAELVTFSTQVDRVHVQALRAAERRVEAVLGEEEREFGMLRGGGVTEAGVADQGA